LTHTILLDTSSLMYRAYFSHPPTIVGADGRPVNAIHGYLDMTARLIGSRHPDELVHVYDHDWRPAARVQMYDGYKSTRKEDPEGLPEQFVLLRDVLDAMGMAQAEAIDWEAEDAIGSIAAQATDQERIDIVTGDRDLIQLVQDPVVRVLFTLRGVTDLAIYDEAGVIAKYGIPPDRYVDFAILRGDPSDALPGVRGVGEKTARDLVQRYASLDAMLEAADGPPARSGLSPALRSKLKDARDYIGTMQRLVPIRTDLLVNRWKHDEDSAVLDVLAEAHALTGPVRRIAAVRRGT
jgi:5'-3' exonuclease